MITGTENQIVFEMADGKRRIVRLVDLMKGDQESQPDSQQLLLWGIFYQLVELNQRTGDVDMEKGEGSGLAAFAAQQTNTLANLGEKLDKLNESMGVLRARVEAPPPDTNKIMADAMEMMRKTLGGLSQGQPPPIVQRPGNGPDPTAEG